MHENNEKPELRDHQSERPAILVYVYSRLSLPCNPLLCCAGNLCSSKALTICGMGRGCMSSTGVLEAAWISERLPVSIVTCASSSFLPRISTPICFNINPISSQIVLRWSCSNYYEFFKALLPFSRTESALYSTSREDSEDERTFMFHPFSSLPQTLSVVFSGNSVWQVP